MKGCLRSVWIQNRHHKDYLSDTSRTRCSTVQDKSLATHIITSVYTSVYITGVTQITYTHRLRVIHRVIQTSTKLAGKLIVRR